MLFVSAEEFELSNPMFKLLELVELAKLFLVRLRLKTSSVRLGKNEMIKKNNF